MFKVLAISALFLVLATEAANLGCKSQSNYSVDGKCPEGQVAIGGGFNCCDKADVYDIDSYACRGESLGPALGGMCFDGALAVADGECCEAAHAYAKNKK
ncbi:unnamed protein product [Caenorhabditis nigoni]